MNTSTRLTSLALLAPVCVFVACGSEASPGSDGNPPAAGSAGTSTSGGATSNGGASSGGAGSPGGSGGSMAGAGGSATAGASSGGSSGATTGNGGAASDPCLTVKCSSGYHCESSPKGTGCVKNDSSKACVVAGDCTLYRDYCKACDCVVQAHNSPDIAPGTECSASMMVSCLLDACLGKSAQCNAGQCVIE